MTDLRKPETAEDILRAGVGSGRSDEDRDRAFVLRTLLAIFALLRWIVASPGGLRASTGEYEADVADFERVTAAAFVEAQAARVTRARELERRLDRARARRDAALRSAEREPDLDSRVRGMLAAVQTANADCREAYRNVRARAGEASDERG